MDHQQKMFYDGKATLKAIRDAEAKRTLTAEEDATKEEILDTLFKEVEDCAKTEFKKRCKKYNIHEDKYNDVRQLMFESFIRELPDYDSDKLMPSTYFTRYFNQVISEYICHTQKGIENKELTPFLASHVNSTICGMEMTAMKTELSKRVLQKTIELENECKNDTQR